jgi:hypothetical protein
MAKKVIEEVKLRKAQSERTLREDGVWMYRDTVSPDEMMASPGYFDEVTTDLIDPEKYFQSPMSSGIGQRFCLLLGDPKAEHYKADFEVDGLVKTVSEAGVPHFRLLWTLREKWRVVDMKERATAVVTGEDRTQDERKVA